MWPACKLGVSESRKLCCCRAIPAPLLLHPPNSAASFRALLGPDPSQEHFPWRLGGKHPQKVLFLTRFMHLRWVELPLPSLQASWDIIHLWNSWGLCNPLHAPRLNWLSMKHMSNLCGSRCQRGENKLPQPRENRLSGMNWELLRSHQKNTCCGPRSVAMAMSSWFTSAEPDGVMRGLPACPRSSHLLQPSAPNPTRADLVWLMRWQIELHRIRLCDKSWSAQRSTETKAGGGPNYELGGRDTLSRPTQGCPGGKPIRMSQWEWLCGHLWDQRVAAVGCLMTCER